MNVLVTNMMLEALQRQTWFAKNANTIVAGLGALAGVLTFVLSFEGLFSVQVATIIQALIAMLTTAAVKLTPNGFQPSQLAKLKNIAQHQELGLAMAEAELGRGKHRL